MSEVINKEVMTPGSGGRKSASHNIAMRLTFSALLVAAAYVLSFIKVFHMPYGGSVTLLSMLPIAVAAYLFGTRTGIIAGTSLGLVNLVANPYVIHPAQLILDYILAFGLLGAGGFLRNTRFGLSAVYLVGIAFRFVCSTLSGAIFFASYAEGTGLPPLLYSAVYNGLYIGAEGLITLVLINIPQIRRFFEKAKRDVEK